MTASKCFEVSVFGHDGVAGRTIGGIAFADDEETALQIARKNFTLLNPGKEITAICARDATDPVLRWARARLRELESSQSPGG